MSATKHTPGSWEAVQWADVYLIKNYQGNIAQTIRLDAFIDGTQGANARLIAASPDLLATMERIVDRIKNHAKNEDAQTLAAIALEAGDAIAKAKGQA